MRIERSVDPVETEDPGERADREFRAEYRDYQERRIFEGRMALEELHEVAGYEPHGEDPDEHASDYEPDVRG